MKLLFSVDQKEALRRGFDADSSTVTIDVPVGDLTPNHRAILAGCLKDGFKVEHAFFPPYGWNERNTRIELSRPDIEGVKEELTRLEALWQAHEIKRQAEHTAKRAEADAKALAQIASPRLEQMVFNHEGRNRWCTNSWRVIREVPSKIDTSDLSPEIAEKAAVENARIEAVQMEVEAEAIAEARRRYAVHQAQKAAEAEEAKRAEAAQEAAKQALIAQLPEILRERMEAGFASDKEVEKAMRKSLREQASLGDLRPFKGWQQEDELNTLTDAQFTRLKQVKAIAAQAATDGRISTEYEVTPVSVWDPTYRPAEDDEDGDEDGEVFIRANERDAIKLTWRHASGLKVVHEFTF